MLFDSKLVYLPKNIDTLFAHKYTNDNNNKTFPINIMIHAK